jgi:hypothetical protein
MNAAQLGLDPAIDTLEGVDITALTGRHRSRHNHGWG